MIDKIYTPVFTGPLKKELAKFLAYKRDCGYSYSGPDVMLKNFDASSTEFDCSHGLSKELALAWTAKQPHQKKGTHRGRIIVLRQFAKFLHKQGLEAYLLPEYSTNEFYTHTPYVFTHDELSRIFSELDKLSTVATSKRNIIFPLVFKILYGCGLRISEVLKLKVGDVDIGNGILTVWNSKGKESRLVPMAEPLAKCCAEYLWNSMAFAMVGDFFFPSPSGGHYSPSTLYAMIRIVFTKCGISHGGRSRTSPCVHSFRHTFAVHSFQQAIDAGKEPMEFLPVLAAYLGHKSYYGTAHYLHLVAEMYPQIVDATEKLYGNLFPKVGEVNEAN